MSKPLALLNTSIIGNDGAYTLRTLTTEEARRIATAAPAIDSAIGHPATAELMAEDLGIEVPVNRQTLQQDPGQAALVFRLNNRPPRGVELDRDALAEIGYRYQLLTRTPEPGGDAHDDTLFGGAEPGLVADGGAWYGHHRHPWEIWREAGDNPFRIARKEGGTKAVLYRRYKQGFATLQDAQRALNEVLRAETEALRGPALAEFTRAVPDRFIPDWSVTVRLYQGAVTLESPRTWEIVLRDIPAEHPAAARMMFDALQGAPEENWYRHVGGAWIHSALQEGTAGLLACEPRPEPEPRRGWLARLTGK